MTRSLVRFQYKYVFIQAVRCAKDHANKYYQGKPCTRLMIFAFFLVQMYRLKVLFVGLGAVMKSMGRVSTESNFNHVQRFHLAESKIYSMPHVYIFLVHSKSTLCIMSMYLPSVLFCTPSELGERRTSLGYFSVLCFNPLGALRPTLRFLLKLNSLTLVLRREVLGR